MSFDAAASQLFEELYEDTQHNMVNVILKDTKDWWIDEHRLSHFCTYLAYYLLSLATDSLKRFSSKIPKRPLRLTFGALLATATW